MEDRRPKSGELYRHFKNRVYQILTIAKHSETGQELVVYQAMYGDFGVYARPLAMFVSEVDHQKYPRITQKYRFEKIDRNQIERLADEAAADSVTESISAISNFEDEEASKSAAEEIFKSSVEESPEPVGEELANPLLLKFLDTDTYHEKYKVLQEIESDMTNRLINDFAVILDVVIPEGDISERYQQLKQCIATQARYENSRLR